MAVELGGILGAAANLTTLMSKEKGAESFIKNVDKFGIQVKNNFEVNFSGFEGVTFFLQSIELPGITIPTADVYYNGRKVEIPICMDYEHDFQMTVLNDAQGYIYTVVNEFLATDAQNRLANSGYTMTIKALTGDQKNYAGALITMKGVRLVSVDGLSYGYDENQIQTFNIHAKLIDYTYTPGELAKIAGVAGTANSILG